jgi:hypothetical protein
MAVPCLFFMRLLNQDKNGGVWAGITRPYATKLLKIVECLAVQELVQRSFADAVGVAQLAGFQVARFDRGDHILF